MISSVIYKTERNKDFKDIGAVIRDFRQRRNLSQERLAELLGVSSSHISRIEGGLKAPSMELLDKIFLILGMRIKIEDTMENKNAERNEEVSG